MRDGEHAQNKERLTMKNGKASIEKKLVEYYARKFSKDTGNPYKQYIGKIWVSWDAEENKYYLRGEGLPSHPKLAEQYPNGWSLLQPITEHEANKVLGIKESKSNKRILSVTIKRMIDEDPDTSWLGEYASSPNSEFSIDRAHSEDCPINNKPTDAIDKLERIIAYVDGWRVEAGKDSLKEWKSLDESIDVLIALQEELAECDCGERGDMQRNEYRYFNPSFNYIDKQGHALPENTAEEVRKYVRQDYERMEQINSGNICFIGVRADARVALSVCKDHSHMLTQYITSGGLWGIESDSDGIEEEEQEQLSELRSQLKALGFSTRAISAAFKNIGRKEE